MICVSFSKPTVEQFLSKHPEVQLIELRLDLMNIDEKQLRHYLSLPVNVIATCRPNDRMTEKQRLTLLRKAITYGAHYVDVEVDSAPKFILTLIEHATMHDCQLIFSYHDFEKTPDLSELEDITELCHAYQADIIKIACMVNHEQDILTIKSLYKKKYSIIALGMGEKGGITRIKACEWGAPFTYATANANEATVAGQMDYDCLYRAISR
jgi:3-dehydroquinate dehydratase type I